MSFEHSLPKFKFTKLFLDFVTKYAYLLHEIIFNIFVKKFLNSFCFLIELKKMLKMSTFWLHASPEALVPLDNSSVDDILIQSRPHARLVTFHSSLIMASELLRFESCLPDTNS